MVEHGQFYMPDLQCMSSSRTELYFHREIAINVFVPAIDHQMFSLSLYETSAQPLLDAKANCVKHQ